jgi:hypothetical protein
MTRPITGSWDDSRSFLERRNEQLRGERDALLEACKEAAESAATGMRRYDLTVTVKNELFANIWRVVSNAIAKAEVKP